MGDPAPGDVDPGEGDGADATSSGTSVRGGTRSGTEGDHDAVADGDRSTEGVGRDSAQQDTDRPAGTRPDGSDRDPRPGATDDGDAGDADSTSGGETSNDDAADHATGADDTGAADTGAAGTGAAGTAADDTAVDDTVEQARAVLAAVDPEDTYKSLLALARSGHGELLQTLEYNKALSFHDPRCVRVEPEPTNLETVELYAGAAYPDFDKVLLQSFLDPRHDDLFNHLQDLLFNDAKNVALVTNHGQIIDIALVLGALLIRMCGDDRRYGVLGDTVELTDLAPRVNVLVSRMVATRQALGVPAMQVLQIGARTFLSIPQTASRRRARLDPEMVKSNNLVMRHELDVQLAEGGQLIAMAASGSQDLSLAAGLIHKARKSWMKRRGEEPPEAGTLHLQPLYDGTIKVMFDCDYVLPLAISLDPAAPACELGSMTKLHEREDCHRVMEWIASAHEEATGVHTIYHRHEDDLLTQVRSLADSLRR